MPSRQWECRGKTTSNVPQGQEYICIQPQPPVLPLVGLAERIVGPSGNTHVPMHLRIQTTASGWSPSGTCAMPFRSEGPLPSLHGAWREGCKTADQRAELPSSTPRSGDASFVQARLQHLLYQRKTAFPMCVKNPPHHCDEEEIENNNGQKSRRE